MSVQDSSSRKTITNEDVKHLTENFDKIQEQLASSLMSKQLDEKEVQQLSEERNAALEQVALLRAKVHEQEQNAQQLIKSHALEMDMQISKYNQLQESSKDEKSQFIHERDQLRTEVEQLNLRENVEIRLDRAEKEAKELVTREKALVNDIATVRSNLDYCRKKLNQAKAIIHQQANKNQSLEQDLNRVTDELAHVRRDLQNVLSGKGPEAAAGDLLLQLQQLQLQLLQKEKELAFNKQINQLEKREKERYEALAAQFEQLKKAVVKSEN